MAETRARMSRSAPARPIAVWRSHPTEWRRFSKGSCNGFPSGAAKRPSVIVRHCSQARSERYRQGRWIQRRQRPPSSYRKAITEAWSRRDPSWGRPRGFHASERRVDSCVLDGISYIMEVVSTDVEGRLAVRLRALRAQNDLTLEALADRSGVSR